MEERLARAKKLFDEIAKGGQSVPFENHDFLGSCLQCGMTGYQRHKINDILRECGFDPVEVWTRFARRAVKLNPMGFNTKKPYDYSSAPSNSISCREGGEFPHEFWRGHDFFHVMGDICLEGDIRLPEGWCKDPGPAFWEHHGR